MPDVGAPGRVVSCRLLPLPAAGPPPQLVASRANMPFGSVADFRRRLPGGALVIDETMLSVKSDWFVVSIDARQGDTIARARALLKRSTTPSEWPTLVWQTVE